jgi:hypothetical protein
MGGCRAATQEEVLYPVAGAVAVDGRPLSVGWITLYPDDSKDNKSTRLPFGEIQKDGSYSLTTNGKPGATAGFYKVVVAATLDPIPSRPSPDWQPTWLHDVKYTKPETTDLAVEVVEKPAAGAYDLRLSK